MIIEIFLFFHWGFVSGPEWAGHTYPGAKQSTCGSLSLQLVYYTLSLYDYYHDYHLVRLTAQERLAAG
jgi:hypothetical protein